MTKNEVLTIIYLTGLTIAFGLISALVFLTNGNARLIKQKLKIGAMIIVLNGAMIGCDSGTVVTCYDPVPPDNYFMIDSDQYTNGYYTVDLSVSNDLRGRIDQRQGSDFSFRLVDEQQAEVQRGDIPADDGVYDESSEEVTILIDTHLSSGVYELYFFDTSASDQPTDMTSARHHYQVNIIE